MYCEEKSRLTDSMSYYESLAQKILDELNKQKSLQITAMKNIFLKEYI